MSNITYVTFLIRAEDDRVTPEQRLAWAKPLLTLDIDLILLVDAFYRGKLPPLGTRVQVKVVSINELETVRLIKDHKFLQLPLTRNAEKDTLNFLTLMNTKPELLVLAKAWAKTPYLAYIDIGISKVLKSPDTLMRLEKLNVHNIPLVMLPGCHPIAPVEAFPRLWSGIHWMLAGGFFVVPATAAEEFFGIHKAALKRFLDLNCITWEVNVWASFANDYKQRIVWYNGPHTDEMITGIPQSVLLRT